MFKFLKDKLKGALAKISKSVEDESPKEELKKEFDIEEKPEIKTQEKIDNELLEIGKPKKKEFKQAEIKEKPKKVKEKKVKKEKVEIEVEEAVDLEEVTREAEEFKEIREDKKEQETQEIIEEFKEEPKEKKGFFSKLKDKFTKKEETEIKPAVKEEPKEKKGFFGTIKEKITTTKVSEEKFESLFEELELALLENNVAYDVVQKIKDDLKKDIVEKPIKRGEVENTISNALKESIEDLFLTPNINLIEKIKEKQEKPFVICFVGQNGAGKTTSIAKVANKLKENKISVVLSASDTFRAAAIQQLKEWGEKLTIKVIAHDYGSDPAAVAFDSISYAKAHKIDVVLVDTAGRQHSNKDLIREMQKIIRVAKPDLKIFVGEAITGNDCVEQAKEFNEAIGIDGIILAKADVDEKGGAMISASYITHRPIMYLGTGQGIKDLKEFNKEEIMNNLGL